MPLEPEATLRQGPRGVLPTDRSGLGDVPPVVEIVRGFAVGGLALAPAEQVVHEGRGSAQR